MTETCGGCVYDGRPLTGVEVAIDAPSGEPGRIRLRGPMLATGYLNSSGEAEATFAPGGWFASSDVGLTKDDGRLIIIERLDNIIITGGVKVAPTPIELLLRADSKVLDALVMGVPDPEWGERVVAIVVPSEPSAPPTVDYLRSLVRVALPRTHSPREFRLVSNISRNELGKVGAAEVLRLKTQIVASAPLNQ
jgi:O-succinylbenzoic acid--CoA ligase